MRFAYISEIYPQNGETWIRYEIEALMARGHTVQVFATHLPATATPPRPPERTPAITYVPEIPAPTALAGLLRLPPALGRLAALFGATREPKRLLRFARAAWQAAALAREVAAFEPDLIVCPFAGNRSLVGCLLAAITGRPYLVITHAVDVWLRRPEMPVFATTARELWTISNFNVRHLRSIYPEIDWGELRMVRVGINLEEFPFAPSDGAGREIVFVGRLVPTKGADLLLRACALLKQRGQTPRVVLMGAGPELPALQRLVAELGIQAEVELAGSTPSYLVAKRLREAAMFVLPCQPDAEWMDGIPVALMEAMAIGAPVITTGISGIPELVVDGESGFLTPHDDVEGLARAIERVWQLEPAERARLVRKARSTVEQHYNVEQVADEIIRVAAERGPALERVRHPRREDGLPWRS